MNMWLYLSTVTIFHFDFFNRFYFLEQFYILWFLYKISLFYNILTKKATFTLPEKFLKVSQVL